MQRRIRLRIVHPNEKMVAIGQVVSISVGNISSHLQQNNSSGRGTTSTADDSSSEEEKEVAGVNNSVDLIIIKQKYTQVSLV